jgi:hypothetical protein
MGLEWGHGPEFDRQRLALLDRYSAAINRRITVLGSVGRANLALEQLDELVTRLDERTEQLESRISRLVGGVVSAEEARRGVEQ